MILSPLLDLVFPRRCHVCGCALVPGHSFVCPACLAAIPRARFHLVRENDMALRIGRLWLTERTAALFIYRSQTPIARLVHDMKYRHMYGIAHEMGRLMGAELRPTGIFTGVDYLCPVPMHLFKQMRRGYNQSRELARGISDDTGIPLATNLKCSRGHRTQTRLTAEQRAANVKGLFRVERPEELDGKFLLLIDDICTTGATLRECIDTLHAASPTLRLGVLTLAAVSRT